MTGSQKLRSIRLPVAQSWSCHRSGGCCREHRIVITRAEASQIEAQGWEQTPELAGQRLLVPADRSGQSYVLAQRNDGSCVFLDERGLCRIHARYGEAAKPLACRLFPYVFVPLGNQTRLSLRFSCPSVVRNRGEGLETQARTLAKLWRELAPSAPTPTQASGPPCATPGVAAASWETLVIYLDTAARLFAEPRGDFRLQALRLAAWHARALPALLLPAREAAEACDRAAIEVVTGVSHEALVQPAPGRLGRVILRVTAARVARRDRLADRGPVRAVRRAAKVVRLAVWPRKLPALGEFPSAQLADIRSVHASITDHAAEPLFRYARIKLWSGQFCGAAFFGLSVHEGLVNLLFLLALAIWLARWHAAGRSLTAIDEAAVEAALRHVDHHFGFDPFLASSGHRMRLRYLWTSGELLRLIAHGGDMAPLTETPPNQAASER